MLFESRISKLFDAIHESREDRVRELLGDGNLDLESRDSAGRTPLILAVEEARPGMLKLLLAAGARVDSPSESGLTPLIVAARHGAAPLMETLLKEGAAVNHTDRNGLTALHAAAVWATRMASLGVTDTEQKLVLLLDAGADPNLADRMGRTPLIASVRSGGGAIEEKSRLPVLKLLIERGAEVDRATGRGRTALLSAAFRGLRETAELLIESGAEVDHRDNQGRTALMNAAEGCFWSYRRAGYIGLVGFLLDKGSNFSLKDKSNLTALDLARRHRRNDLVKLLEKAGDWE